MLKYLNGIIGKEIPNETTLSILLSEEEGTPILLYIDDIINTYHRYISCIRFIGGENDQQELAELCKVVHKGNLKTCFVSNLTEPSQITKKLTDELDYFESNKKIFTKDYCPFGDIYDWTEV